MNEGSATPRQIELMRHMLGASHPDTPLGWRNYGAWNKNDEDMLTMIEKGMVIKTSERDGMLWTKVAPAWIETLGAVIT